MSLLGAIVDWNDPAPPIEELGAILSALPECSPDCRRFVRLPHALLGSASRVVRAAERIYGYLVGATHRGLWALGDVRLDNRDELKEMLADGAALMSSDIGIVLAAYQRWGGDAAEHLVGDFAFIIWNSQQRELYAARDPFGVRSLVYHSLNGRLTFATDPAQLLALARVERVPNDQTVVDFLSWSFAHYGGTFFKGIQAIRPGHYLRANQHSLSETEFFRPPDSLIRYRRAEDYQEEFRLLFRRAVKDRLDSQYPMVAHLSGGLDSSSIVCMANRLCRDGEVTVPNLHVVSAYFPGRSYDEEPFIKEVLREVEFESHSWDGNVPSGDEFVQSSLSIPGANSGFNGGSTGDVEIARKIGARVMLSGDPGDAVTGESGLFNEFLVRHDWLNIGREVLSGGTPNERRIRARLLKLAIREEVPAVLLSVWRAMNRRPGLTLPGWFRPELGPLWSGPENRRPKVLGVGVNRLQQRIWDNLRWSRTAWAIDRQGVYAAHAGIEVRFPLLDARLVRFILSVPVEYRVNGRLRRSLHRESMAGILPQSIARRVSKPIFNGAVVRWGHASRDAIREMFESSRWQSGKFVDREKALDLFHALCSKPPFDGDRLGWLAVRSIVHVETWLRAVLGYSGPQEILPMSEIKGPPEGGEFDDGRASYGPYVPPLLEPVGNVRDLVASGPLSGDDATPPTPGLGD